MVALLRYYSFNQNVREWLRAIGLGYVKNAVNLVARVEVRFEQLLFAGGCLCGCVLLLGKGEK